MTFPIIDYVPPTQIYPCFGIAYPSQNKILISRDLSGRALQFVLDHELYHLQDASTSILWREIKANAYAGWKNPTGLILVIIMTVCSFDRLKLYLKRFRGGF